MTTSPLEPATPLQKKLAAAKAWLPADIDALFRERESDAVAFFASIVEKRDVVGSPKAYDILHPLLFKLVDRPKIDVEALVPLLRRIVAFEQYNPGGTFAYEAVRHDALRLLARRGDLAARAMINRFVSSFPANRDRSDGPALVTILAEAATDLGAPELVLCFKELLPTLLRNYSPKERTAALAEAEAAVAKLARVKRKPLVPEEAAANADVKAKAARKPKAAVATPAKPAKPVKATPGLLRGVELVDKVMEKRRASGEKLTPAPRGTIDSLGFEPSPGLRRWLEHDGEMFVLGDPEPFATLLEREVGIWSEAFAPLARYLTGPCVIFDGWGADSRRILYLGSTDALGEYTVLTLDTDDEPFACVNGPVDVWLAQQAGYLDPESEYGVVPKAYGPTRTEHARRVLGGFVAFSEQRFSKRLG